MAKARFSVGDRVRHAANGGGEVIAVRDDQLWVRFDRPLSGLQGIYEELLYANEVQLEATK